MNDDKKQSPILGLVFNLLNFIQSTVEFWAPFLGGVMARLFHASWYIVIGVMVAVLILLFLLIPRLRLLLSARLLSFAHNLLPINKDYECRNKVAEYTYECRETMNFRVSYEAKFYSGTHREIPERIKWSAGDVDNIVPIVQGQTITVLPEDTKDDVLFQLGYQNLRIDLPKTYSKQDRFFPTGYYCVCPPDPEHKAMTCLVIGIYQKIHRLTLRVRFEKNIKVANIRKLKYARYLDEVPYENEHATAKPDKEQKYFCVEFKIKHPIPGAKYAIDWEFQEL